MPTDLDIGLGQLSDPLYYTSPIVLHPTILKEEAIRLLKKMILIRVVEQKIAELVVSKVVWCPCHLGVGQEAIAVGVAEFLKKTDRVFGNHRSHSHYLSLGGDVYSLIAEIFGYETGCASGIGGSMHLIDKGNGFWGSVPIVAGTIPLAAGAALAAKFKKEDSIGVCFFGDGATEEGGFHETMNLASIQKLPMLFVCENNLYSSHLDIKQRQPNDSISRYARAHCIDYKIVDGNDVFAVMAAAEILIDGIRNGKGPGFLEAVTYRWLGHVGGNEDIDVGVRRSLEDLNKWKKRDPIKRLMDAMIINGWIVQDDYSGFCAETDEYVSSELKRAKQSNYPAQDKLLYKVYYSS